MPEDQSHTLREEISELGEVLGQTIQELAGEESLRTVEEIRRFSRDARNGLPDAGERVRRLIASLDVNQLRIVIRAFSVFLDLANLAEDRHRVRVLQQRARKAYPAARNESIEDALFRLKEAGKSASEVQQVLDQLQIELVFTAHPTEAKRRSARGKLRQIRDLLNTQCDDRHPAECCDQKRLIRTELAKLWLTDFIRPWRPTVMQEVQRGLSFKPVLWSLTPKILDELRSAASKAYPESSIHIGPTIKFGSWIGGDRDGHPYVTADVTEKTIVWLRRSALDFHLSTCRDLFDSLSLSVRQMMTGDSLSTRCSEARAAWPCLEEILRKIPPYEMVRTWLAVIRWRLQRTREVQLDGSLIEGAYSSPEELDRDVSILHDLGSSACPDGLLVAEVSHWLDQIRTFGFHLARLDVRQDSRVFAAVVNERVHPRFADQTHQQRAAIVERATMSHTLVLKEPPLLSSALPSTRQSKRTRRFANHDSSLGEDPPALYRPTAASRRRQAPALPKKLASSSRRE